MNLKTNIRMLGFALLLTAGAVNAETGAPQQPFDTVTAYLAAALATLVGIDATQLQTDLQTLLSDARACAASR